MRILTIALIFIILFSFYASARSNSGGLAERVAELEAQVAAMEEILQYVRVETEEMDGMTGPHWIFEGANVHVRSGSGDTADGCEAAGPSTPICESLTGLGNLIVGYNERRLFRGSYRQGRPGSHNLVVGDFHSYLSFGGFVAGGSNRISGSYASVLGGSSNRATGFASSICGGQGNEASAIRAAVSGGLRNIASGESSSVSGGKDREALDDYNWAAGSLLEAK